MKNIFNFKNICWGLGAIVLLVAFNNCGEGFVAQGIGGISGGSVMFSRAPGESCEDALVKVYASTYHPFLSQTCNSCHINGPGIGTFASPDVATSYTSFASIGADKISSQAVNDAHKPPYTGSQNTARIDEIKGYWAAAQTDYASCVAADGGSLTGAFVVHTDSTMVPAKLSTTFTRMQWDLETQSNGKIPLIAGIDIRQSVIGGVVKGYEFRNPTLRLKNTTSGNYEARALNLYINNALSSEVTTYMNIDYVISTTTDLNMSAGTANGFAAVTPAATDVIALEFQYLGSTTGAPNPGSPVSTTPTPAPTATPIGTVTYTQLVAAGGVFKTYCLSCHTGANASGSLDLTVYNNAKVAAQNIKSRVNNANNPMPSSGLLSQTLRDTITAWVDQGAPQ